MCKKRIQIEKNRNRLVKTSEISVNSLPFQSLKPQICNMVKATVANNYTLYYVNDKSLTKICALNVRYEHLNMRPVLFLMRKKN